MKNLEKIKAGFFAFCTFILGVLFLLFRKERARRKEAEEMAENFEVQVEAVAETSQKLAEVKEEKAKALTKAAEISVSAKESEVSDHIQEEKVVKGSDFNKLMEDLWKN